MSASEANDKRFNMLDQDDLKPELFIQMTKEDCIVLALPTDRWDVRLHVLLLLQSYY
jgi:hypothetical protein